MAHGGRLLDAPVAMVFNGGLQRLSDRGGSRAIHAAMLSELPVASSLRGQVVPADHSVSNALLRITFYFRASLVTMSRVAPSANPL